MTDLRNSLACNLEVGREFAGHMSAADLELARQPRPCSDPIPQRKPVLEPGWFALAPCPGVIGTISVITSGGLDFMIFWIALKELAALAEVPATPGSWYKLVADLKSIMRNGVSQDFLDPTTLALVRVRTIRPPVTVSGPASGLTDRTSLRTTISYQ